MYVVSQANSLQLCFLNNLKICTTIFIALLYLRIYEKFNRQKLQQIEKRIPQFSEYEINAIIMGTKW